jgi:uncharacterized FlgJ-related protein
MKIYRWDKTELEMVRIRPRVILYLILAIAWFYFVVSIISYKEGLKTGKNDKITENDVVLLYMDSENNSFSRKKFYEYLKKINIKFPELVFAQAVKESGFRSKIWKDNHNPFGMKEASKRPNKQNGVQHGHAFYDTWKDACIDYAFYQSYIGLSKVKTEDDYLQFLKEMNYYDTEHPGNETYLNDLKKIADNIENYIKD